MGHILERTAFVFHEGQLHVQEKDDHRPCEEWVKDKLGLGHEQWAQLTRGYIRPTRIQFFTGESYSEDLTVSAAEVDALKKIHCAQYGFPCKDIFNGVIPGAEDTVWDPIYEYDPHGGGWYLV